MTNAEARCNNSLRPRKPEGSLGRIAQDGHLDSHTAPELYIYIYLFFNDNALLFILTPSLTPPPPTNPLPTSLSAPLSPERFHFSFSWAFLPSSQVSHSVPTDVVSLCTVLRDVLYSFYRAGFTNFVFTRHALPCFALYFNYILESCFFQ